MLQLLAIAVSLSLTGCGGSGSSDSSATPAPTPTPTPTPTPANSVPQASAGQDQTVTVGQMADLDGSASTDADGDPLTYSWSFDSIPEGSLASLSDQSGAVANFTADVAGTYVVSLIVNDGTDESQADLVNITALSSDPQPGNNDPVADAGIDQSVSTGSTVSLDGGNSSDADGDPLAFNWVFDSIPAGSQASLVNPMAQNSSFEADLAGSYVVSLVVNDGAENSQPDTVTITVSNTNVDITNAEFTNQSGQCDSYIGSYFSNVTDIQRALGFTGSINITDSGNGCQLTSNEIPNHDFNDASARFATDVSEQSSQFQIDKTPSFANQVTQVSLQVTNVVFLNGATLDLLAAACYDVGNEPLGDEKIGCGQDQVDNPWRYDPMSSLNRFGTDQNNAHTQPDGTYHYHGNPVAMFDQDCNVSGNASPVIGFAADGYPVFGFCFEDESGVVRKAQSSYQLKDDGGSRQPVAGYTTPQEGVGAIASANYDGQFIGDWEYQSGTGDLDECNGMMVNGQYGYFITEQYPWVLACYKGTPDASFSKTGTALANRMHSHEPGQSHSH